MSLTVTIKQKAIIKRQLPVVDILTSDGFGYGSYEDDSWRLEKGKVKNHSLILFDTRNLARGIKASWDEEGLIKIDLKLMMPTGEQEIHSFYSLVQMISEFWKAEIEVDGRSQSLDDFVFGMRSTIVENERIFYQMRDDILRKGGVYFLTCALWPLNFGPHEASQFDDPQLFEEWMHEKQRIDAYYAIPHFYRESSGDVHGSLILSSDTRTILPAIPEIPQGKGMNFTCSEFLMNIFSTPKRQILYRMDYQRFIKLLPENLIKYYDATNFLLEGISEQDLIEYFGQEQN
ncbi:MAG: DUF4299 family protein [Erysipelotrichaceae bacterium]|nr:DUF4299 family protein [Erysipelotrichaceae bacterium]